MSDFRLFLAGGTFGMGTYEALTMLMPQPPSWIGVVMWAGLSLSIYALPSGWSKQ